MTGWRHGEETMADWVARLDARLDRLAVTPHHVYRAFDEFGLLLYIGCTVDVQKRMTQHRATSLWHRYTARVDVATFSGRAEARAAEQSAINTEAAFFNATQADIQNTQANLNAARWHLQDCGIYRPRLEMDDLDDSAVCDLHAAEDDAYQSLLDEVRAELKSGEYPYRTPEDRLASYLAARAAAGSERVA